MERIILARCGELMLKGLNRSFFEKKLVKNINNAIRHLGDARVTKKQGRVYIEPLNDNFKFDQALKAVSKVFGIVSISPVAKVNCDFDTISEKAVEMVKDIVNRHGYKTFKVETRRADKSFPMKSPEVSGKLGAVILENIPSLSVDVNSPSFTFFVEIREWAYIFTQIVPANGGLPVGTNGKATLLLSGGIDSPVAGWMMAKRGVELEAVHFYSFPYTSERSKEKVIDLARILSEYSGPIKLHIVPFTDIQTEINEKCPQNELTIIMRRIMMEIAERISQNNNSLALITGESMGQVASQTIQALSVTNAAVSMPVFRPLIGMDKDDVVKIARKIETFETSILPYEDCCTVFVAKHPKTRLELMHIERSEKKLDVETMIINSINDTEVITLK